jgi:hypothetical protein
MLGSINAFKVLVINPEKKKQRERSFTREDNIRSD